MTLEQGVKKWKQDSLSPFAFFSSAKWMMVYFFKLTTN